MTYTTPTPSTVANGDQFQASSYNIISADIQDHESRIAAIEPGHKVLTTAQKNALTGVTTGTMVYDSTLGVLQTWNGSAWVIPFPYLYSSGLTGSIGNGSYFDISWPSSTRDITIEIEANAITGAPSLSWTFLNGATPLNAAQYTYTSFQLDASYTGSVTTSATSVSLYAFGTMPWKFEITAPQNSQAANSYPRYSVTRSPSSAIGGYAGFYNVASSTVTGIRITNAGASTSANLYYRVIVI